MESSNNCRNTDLELNQRADGVDLNATKRTCEFCAAARASSSSRHNTGNIIILTIPLCLVFIPTVFVSIAYIYAHVKGTLKLPGDRNVPFISDIGEGLPQSNLFSFGLAIGAFCTAAMVIVRYLQVKYFVDNISPRVNHIGLVSGLFIAIGQVAVASFQLSGLTTVHYLGALIYSFSAVIFAPIQTYISCKEKTLYGIYREIFLYLRGFLSAGILLAFLIFGMFFVPPLAQYNERDFPVSQTGEWCFAGFKMVFMLTFVVDFWRLQPRVVFEKS